MQILVTLIVVGVLLWLVNSFIPMAASIKSPLNAVVVIFTVLMKPIMIAGKTNPMGRLKIPTVKQIRVLAKDTRHERQVPIARESKRSRSAARRFASVLRKPCG